MKTKKIVISASIVVLGAVFGLIHRAANASSAAVISMPRNNLFQGAGIDSRTLAIFERACQNCHSASTQWPWYSQLPLISSMIQKDVREARQHVDLSRWNSYLPYEQAALLSAIGATARTGVMPPARYTLLHRDSALTAQERESIYQWTKAERHRLRQLSLSVPKSAPRRQGVHTR